MRERNMAEEYISWRTLRRNRSIDVFGHFPDLVFIHLANYCKFETIQNFIINTKTSHGKVNRNLWEQAQKSRIK